MNLSDDYIREQEDVIHRNYKYRTLYWTTERFIKLRAFCQGCKKSLSIGCGGYEPFVIQATHALDVSPIAKEYLDILDWKGVFVVGSCTDLPFKDKEFDAAVCTEVIEHLPTLWMVEQTFREIDRVAKKWIVTTPCNPLGPLNTEPTHKFAFTMEELFKFLPGVEVCINKDALYWYVIRDEKK